MSCLQGVKLVPRSCLRISISAKSVVCSAGFIVVRFVVLAFEAVKDVSSLNLCTKSLRSFGLLTIRCMLTEAVVGFYRSPSIINWTVVVGSSMSGYLAAIILDLISASFRHNLVPS